jgi:uncharacterized SAM-binding protein YcdF (DUF218 family)
VSATLADALLPPAVCGLLALVLLLARRPRGAAAALAVLVALSTPLVGRLLLGPLLLPPAAAPGEPPGAIVILPGDALDLLNPAGTEPGLYTLDRLRTGAALQRRTALPILVSGGQAPDGRTPQASAMAESLRADFQVPVRWQETRSRSVWQSAAYSGVLLREAGIGRVYLVADGWDERLAVKAFRRAGVEVTPAPVRRPDPLSLDRYVFLPGTPGWLDSMLALRQWAGLACSALPLCAAWATGGPRPDPS